MAKSRRFQHREAPVRTRDEGGESREDRARLECRQRPRQREKRLAKRAGATPTRERRHENPAMERRENEAPVKANERRG